MSRTFTPSVVLVAALLTVPAVAATPEIAVGAQAAPTVSAADAAPFIGDWTLTLEGPQGPASFDLSVKLDGEKVSAVLTSDQMGTQPITGIAKADKALTLSYMFTYEGNPIDGLIRLTPGAEGKMGAQAEFAGGAYVMTGSAAKKEKAK